MTTVDRLRYLQCSEWQPRSRRPGVGQLVLSRTVRGRNRCQQQRASQGLVRKQRCVGAQTMPACRQQHISAEEACSGRRQKHITELARLRGDPQCHTQDVWVGSGQTQGSGEAHRDVVGACLIKPGNTSPPDGAGSTDQPLQHSPRGCSAFLPRALPSRKNAPPRALPTNVASISPTHLSGFVMSQLLRGAGICRSRQVRRGRSFEGASHSPLLPPHTTPARRSAISPAARGWVNFAWSR